MPNFNLSTNDLSYMESNDPSIKSTILGIAIRTLTTDSCTFWTLYNVTDNLIKVTNLGCVDTYQHDCGCWSIFELLAFTEDEDFGIDLGNFPIYLIPCFDLGVGDLIKHDNDYCFVSSVTDNQIVLFNTKNDRDIILHRDISDLKLFTKVIALSSSLDLDNYVNAQVIATLQLENMSNPVARRLAQVLPFFLTDTRSNVFEEIGLSEIMMLALFNEDLTTELILEIIVLLTKNKLFDIIFAEDSNNSNGTSY